MLEKTPVEPIKTNTRKKTPVEPIIRLSYSINRSTRM